MHLGSKRLTYLSFVSKFKKKSIIDLNVNSCNILAAQQNVNMWTNS